MTSIPGGVYTKIWRCFLISKNELLINEGIRDKQVRVVDSDGTMLGVMDTNAARDIAYSKNLDLVVVAPQADPPVCRVMDHGKYLFEMTKKEKEARKKQKIVEVKEVRVTPGIEDHDFDFKSKNARKFLQAGDKVKITVRFKGRELNYIVLGEQVLNRFAEVLSDVGVVEKKPVLTGRMMIMFVSPK